MSAEYALKGDWDGAQGQCPNTWRENKPNNSQYPKGENLPSAGSCIKNHLGQRFEVRIEHRVGYHLSVV